MTEALQLFDAPATPRLTDRQQTAYDQIAAAGWYGLHTDEVGARVHDWQGRHGPNDICAFCGSTGSELGKSLRAKGLVQQRRRKAPNGDTVTVWTAAGKLERPEERDDGNYNVFPKGF